MIDCECNTFSLYEAECFTVASLQPSHSVVHRHCALQHRLLWRQRQRRRQRQVEGPACDSFGMGFKALCITHMIEKYSGVKFMPAGSTACVCKLHSRDASGGGGRERRSHSSRAPGNVVGGGERWSHNSRAPGNVVGGGWAAISFKTLFESAAQPGVTRWLVSA